MKCLLIVSALVLASCAQGQTIDLGDGISIIGVVLPFDSAKHTITRCKVLDWQYEPVCLIDGEPFFGADLDRTLPLTELTLLRVALSGKEIALDVSGMFNPNGYADLRPDQFKVREAEGGHEVLGLFSDGAGTYVAVWKIVAGGSIRTLISQSEDEVVHWWHEVQYPINDPGKR